MEFLGLISDQPDGKYLHLFVVCVIWYNHTEMQLRIKSPVSFKQWPPVFVLLLVEL